MPQYIDHKTTFLEQHRHFRLAIVISRRFRTACGGLELKESKVQQQMFGFPEYAIYVLFLFKENDNLEYILRNHDS